LQDKIFYFEGVRGDNDAIRQLSLWIADDENKTNPKCIVANGKIYGLASNGFLYVNSVKDYGYFFSTKAAYRYGDSVTTQPTVGEATKYSQLEEYILPHPGPIR
jgi:hypothetical protein